MGFGVTNLIKYAFGYQAVREILILFGQCPIPIGKQINYTFAVP